MRAPWTALRDARAEIEAERDERGEVIRLRRERIELRAAAAVGVVGLLVLSGRSMPRPDDGGLPWPPAMTVLLLMLLAWLAAHAVARIRHGDAVSPEAERADALRSLILLPGGVALGGFVYWYLGTDDLRGTLIWVAFYASFMTVALVVRYRRTKRDVELAAERDEGRDDRD